MDTTPRPNDAPERPGTARRHLLAGAGFAVAAATFAATSPADASTATRPLGRGNRPQHGADPVRTPAVDGLHLQFGADAATEVVASWHTLQPVQHPRVFLGDSRGTFERTAAATTVSYVDAKSGRTVYAHHAPLRRLRPSNAYLYAALHDGAAPQFGEFTTGPKGRARVTFTSFGDQGTPTLGKLLAGAAKPTWVNDNLGGPAGADTTAGVERVQPMFHLFNGDLCYANLAEDRIRTWWDFWDNNSRSARNRPWMPSAGNHENELGNGPIGYEAYQTYFSLPGSGGPRGVTRGLWYSFTIGAVRVISIANDDVCYQDGGNTYVRGYSDGAQQAWLERELKAARRDRGIDWVVVCMHQVAISSADQANGADLGIRQEWVPLFDRYGVDLVVCGHEHHYERSHPIRGQAANATLTPKTAVRDPKVVDTTKGTVHMILGGGGTSVTSNQVLFDPPQCRVITAVGAPDPTTGKRPPIYTTEPADWSASRDRDHSYGFAGFEVDPGRPGGDTTITVTYYNTVGTGGALEEFETFTLRRPRSDR
ncbi:purple acid phosphatase family protein [Luteipulveratus mongoliensis]|uniref:Metallophosphoesterase n=1 Tax=Luteipulveratus mongoliensis TaxID=571913 RepID=A0A0K1JDW6_9MICO|nr:metallophosphoesterase family protein [Luteipulveratus mongoliensis]AKU14901.1 hypothetical protein VV02_01850 [Luteipulveratus mongoliensis]